MSHPKTIRRTRITFSSLPLALLCVYGLSSLVAQAAFTAEVTSEKNMMRGGSIEIMVTPETFNVSGDQPLSAGDKVTFGGTVKNTGKNVLQYSLVVSGDDESSCSQVHLTVQRAGTTVSASMFDASYVYDSEPLAAGAEEPWVFEFWIPDGTSFDEGNTGCNFSFHFEARQTLSPDAVQGGWTDTAILPDLHIIPTVIPVIPVDEPIVTSLSVDDVSAVEPPMEEAGDDDTVVSPNIENIDDMTPGEPVPIVSKLVDVPAIENTDETTVSDISSDSVKEGASVKNHLPPSE